MKREFAVPQVEDMLEYDRKLIFSLKQSMGVVPNIYAFMTRSETALKRFLDFIDVPTVFDSIQTIAIHLVASQANQTPYCLAYHTTFAEIAGLTDVQIESIRKGNVTWDEKLAVLVDFTCELVNNAGKMTPEMLDRFYEVGYTDAYLVDLVMLLGMNTMMDYLSNATWLPVDFPEAPVVICKCNCKK